MIFTVFPNSKRPPPCQGTGASLQPRCRWNMTELLTKSYDGPGFLAAPSYEQEEQIHLARVASGKRTGRFTQNLTITPRFASMVLERYAPAETNRHRRPAHVKRFAQIIRDGRWEPETHQGIAFRLDGILSDGQHRLAAVVAAGIPIRVDVTYGQPDRVFRVIDQNTPRGAADLVVIAGLDIKQPANAAAAARLLMMIERGFSLKGSIESTRDEVLSFVAVHVDDLNEAVRIGSLTARGINRHIGVAAISASVYLVRAAGAEQSKVEWFFGRLRDGANLAQRSPILVLRESLRDGAILTNNPQGPDRLRQTTGAIIQAWNNWRDRVARSSAKQITVTAADPFPVPRP
jgi:hypothetical protein